MQGCAELAAVARLLPHRGRGNQVAVCAGVLWRCRWVPFGDVGAGTWNFRLEALALVNVLGTPRVSAPLWGPQSDSECRLPVCRFKQVTLFDTRWCCHSGARLRGGCNTYMAVLHSKRANASHAHDTVGHDVANGTQVARLQHHGDAVLGGIRLTDATLQNRRGVTSARCAVTTPPVQSAHLWLGRKQRARFLGV